MTSSRPAPPMPPLKRGAKIAIIGGGASGMLLATHLLQDSASEFQVTLIEARHDPGRGVAYSTKDPDHLLNTRVAQMSAFPDQPGHLLDWLQAQPEHAERTAADFISRRVYGDYLVALGAPLAASGRLQILQDKALTVQDNGTRVTLASGAELSVDLTVLATGLALPEADPQGLITGAWEFNAPQDPESTVVIIGTGLSMVDQALSLLNKGHRGPILAYSRRGLLPLPHAASKPLALTPEDLSPGQGLAKLLHHLRRLADQAGAAGGTWRDVMDGVRPFVATLWQRMSEDQRRRFLRHGAAWWEIHRHRIPEASDRRLRQAMEEAQLRITRAGFQGAERQADGRLTANLRLRGSRTVTQITASAIVDCRGIRRDPVSDASAVLQDLFARGLARVDALKIGPDVTADGRLITQSGDLLPGAVAVGPPTRAALWEITAIPDIRVQAQALARALRPA